mmetsp:Transcript_39539/g.45398  ORF Transcript_39539/g.45398 Transcript_39539/m.45398 type:complete len:131 (-) Transcript_39539:1877-2269(-)|eukprot:CAMPEP_0168319378 /NCGR_PEP_ID=MMETSP0213-20121227/1022_1 /TAXON_ID=151035 /ORGANISM="Euplotes harpa, Strain FSP1.4" /LENGTH=130 /DNA_ID=CAMNT_0008320591 /DNA_START=109 /DNA_END=501 /DNA_ORIENTATION=-
MKNAVKFMKKIKFFAQRQIEDDDYLLLMNSMKHVYHPKGHIMNDDGLGHQTSAFEFYIVLMGTVAVYIDDPSHQQFLAGGLKKMKKLNGKCFEHANEVLADKYEFMRMKAGDAFGETALLNGTPPEESYL